MIEITFDNSVKEVSAFGLTQWDKGQKLKILWDDMPLKFQVHFTSRGSHEAIVVSAESQSGTAVVDIPDELLKNSADIFAWIYLTEGENVGESTKRAVLYVRPRAKPHTDIEDLELTQQEILEDILGDIKDNIQHIKENGIDAEYIPDYVKKQAEEIVRKVAAIRNENSVVFIAAGDAHLENGDYNSENAVKHMSQAMRIIAEGCPVDFMAYLGDMTSGGSDKAITDAQTEIVRVNSALSEVEGKVPFFRLFGSEDSLNKAVYRNGCYIDSLMLYNLIGRWNKDADYPESEKVRGYCYRDLEKEKLRVICLNTSDTHGINLEPYSETAVIGSAQLHWLCESLDLSSKSDSGAWKIILLGHHPLNMKGKFNLVKELLEAYVSGGSLDVMTSAAEHLVCDFAGKNSAKIIGQFHGHLHNYKVSFITSKNIPLVAIPNAGFYDNNFYADSSYTYDENTYYGENVTYNKTVNSAIDTAFCVVVADKLTGEINAIHYGAGVDRKIVGTYVTEDSPTMPDEGDDNNSSGDNTDPEPDDNNGNDSGNDNENGSGTYTNMVPLSTTSQGYQYCGKGYFEGNMLLSTGSILKADEYVHTGFIPADSTSVIRVSGGYYDGSKGNALLVYDSNFNFIWEAALDGVRNSDSGVAYTDTGVLVFRPADVVGGISNMAYIRVSTIGVGSNLILTINENIDGSEVSGNEGSPIVAYTNIVKYATDKNGASYATNGYKNNHSLSSSGEEQQNSGYVVTGFLVLGEDAVIRIKGVNYDGREGSCICLYNQKFELVKTITLTGSTDNTNGITVSGNILKFVPTNAGLNLNSVSCFRVSGIGSGNNLIITYSEEIK